MPKRGILDRLRSDNLAFFDLHVGTLELRIGAVENVRDQARIVALKHWEQLEAYVAGHSSFMTSFAGFQGLLRRYTGLQDISVGTAIANRNRLEDLRVCLLNGNVIDQ